MDTETRILHGTALSIYGTGVLIMGKPGTGKSQLALELIQEGHKLVCDDACIASINKLNRISISCPKRISGLLAIRDIGIFNIHEAYDKELLQIETILDLIICLDETSDKSLPVKASPKIEHTSILGVNVPTYLLAKTKGRNLASIIDLIIRTHNHTNKELVNNAHRACE